MELRDNVWVASRRVEQTLAPLRRSGHAHGGFATGHLQVNKALNLRLPRSNKKLHTHPAKGLQCHFQCPVCGAGEDFLPPLSVYHVETSPRKFHAHQMLFVTKGRAPVL